MPSCKIVPIFPKEWRAWKRPSISERHMLEMGATLLPSSTASFSKQLQLLADETAALSSTCTVGMFATTERLGETWGVYNASLLLPCSALLRCLLLCSDLSPLPVLHPAQQADKANTWEKEGINTNLPLRFLHFRSSISLWSPNLTCPCPEILSWRQRQYEVFSAAPPTGRQWRCGRACL